MLKNFCGALKSKEQFTENFLVDQFRHRRSSLSQGQAVVPPDEAGYAFHLKKCTLVAEVACLAGPPQKPGVEDGEATAAATFAMPEVNFLTQGTRMSNRGSRGQWDLIPLQP